LVLVLCSAAVLAESARGLVRRGNRAYEAGRFDEAMKAYEQADVESPESPVVAFNQGTVKYRAEDFAAAREAFQKAAKGSRDPRFEAKCRYNLGDCWFREVRRQMDSDLAKAVEACERSVDEYQAALALDPQLEAARRNIEVVRRLWKSILDEQKRRQEEQKAQQEQQQKLAEQLKQLIERQEQAAGQSAELAKQQASEGPSQAVQQQAAAQAGSQTQLGKDTQAFADTLQQTAAQAQPPQAAPGTAAAPQPQPAAPQHPALSHLQEARQAQDQAVQKLGQTQPGAATDDQKQAAEALRKALESMSQKQDGQQGQQPQQGQQQQQEPKQQDQGKDPQNGEEQKPGQEQEEKQGQEQEQGQGQGQGQGEEQAQQQEAQEGGEENQDPKDRQQARARLADEDARDILDHEKRNRDRRTAGEQRGLAPVDKDW